MALPVTITGAVFPPSNYNPEPIIDGNGNVYLVLPDAATGGNIKVWKNTDPDNNSFAEVDGAGRPTQPGSRVWAHKDGTKLHVVSQEVDTDTDPGFTTYHVFNLSDDASPDQWSIIDEVITSTGGSNVQTRFATAVSLRSDGDVIALYNGPRENVMGTQRDRIVYARRESAVWTVDVAVSETGTADDDRAASIVRGESDKMFFAFMETNVLTTRSLDSANTLGTRHEVLSGFANGSIEGLNKGVYFDDAGTERIRFPAFDTNPFGTIKTSIVRIDDDGTPATTQLSTDTSDDTSGQTTGGLVVEESGGKVHAFWASEGDGNDLYKNVADSPHTTWGTDTEVLDATTINKWSGNAFTRGGSQVIGYVYDDGGTVKYNEFVISAGGTTHTVSTSDNLGLSDSTLRIAHGNRNPSDNLGFQDTVSRLSDANRAIAVSMGLQDAAQRIADAVRTLSDNLGFSDDVASRLFASRSVTDNLGFTDSATLSVAAILGITTSDSLGMQDAFQRIADALRQVLDNLGFNDAFQRQSDANREMSDSLGLSDAVLRVSDANRNVSDDFGFADEVQRAGEAFRQAVDNLGLQDAANREVDLLRLLTDNLGLSDDVTILEVAAALEIRASDSIGFSDAIQRVVDALRQAVDNLGLSDDVQRASDANRIVNEFLGGATAFQRTSDANRTAAESLGASTQFQRIADALRQVSESVGLSELVAAQGIKPDPADYSRLTERLVASRLEGRLVASRLDERSVSVRLFE